MALNSHVVDQPLDTNRVAVSDDSPYQHALSGLFLVAWILPIIAIFGLIARYAVDVPYWDEWADSYFMTAAHARGYPLFSELFAQHNESRNFFPRIVFFYLGELTHWNLRVQMFFNAGVMVIAALGLLILIRRRLAPAWRALLVAAVANVLLFSPGQWENWFWGIQLVVFVPTAALVWALICLDKPNHFWLRFVFAATLTVIATYSYANGMAIWVVLFPSVVLCARGNRRRIWVGGISWIILAVVSIAAYFHGYQSPGTPFFYSLHHPALLCLYFIRFLGNGLRVSSSGGIATVIGVGSLIAVAAVALRVLRRWREDSFLTQWMPWIALIIYTLISAATAAAGRLGLGLQFATGSRYQTFSVPLFIGLLVIAAFVLEHWRPSASVAPAAYFSFGAGTMLFAVILAQAWTLGIKETRWQSDQRLSARVCVQFYYVAPETKVLAERLFPRTDLLPERVRAVEQAGLLSCGLIQSSDVSKLDGGGKPGRNGSFDDLNVDGPTTFVHGWASVDHCKRPADAVLLTAPDAEGIERIFAIVENSHESRSDVAAGFKNAALRHCGWSKTIATSRIPRGKLITAWGFDTYTKKAYRLAWPKPMPKQ